MAWNEQSLPTSGDPISSEPPGVPGASGPLPPRPGGMPGAGFAGPNFGPNPSSPDNPNMANTAPVSPDMSTGMAPGLPAAPEMPAANPNVAMPPEAYPGPAATNPLLRQAVPPAASQQATTVGTQRASAPAATGAMTGQDDETDVDDVVWVNRTKKVIATTHGDPHRRVQLLQQLSVLYLKEKYGRSVHADEV